MCLCVCVCVYVCEHVIGVFKFNKSILTSRVRKIWDGKHLGMDSFIVSSA